MLTAIDQETNINGAKFYSRPCRFESQCLHYNPALTIPVTIKGIDGPTTIQKLNNCTHGGGAACETFKFHLQEKIFVQGGFRLMSQTLEISDKVLWAMTSEDLNLRLAEIAFHTQRNSSYSQARERQTILKILRVRGLR